MGASLPPPFTTKTLCHALPFPRPHLHRARPLSITVVPFLRPLSGRKDQQSVAHTANFQLTTYRSGSYRLWLASLVTAYAYAPEKRHGAARSHHVLSPIVVDIHLISSLPRSHLAQVKQSCPSSPGTHRASWMPCVSEWGAFAIRLPRPSWHLDCLQV